ncbi:transglutaminase domain-containing protein [Holdemanella biformis]|uniref:transglutaminase domain-containing protein n=1 Tax=Holdemanella biformis TaxID=1735 RepID=UPI002E76DB60|nr:transglutaminase domain-containing protein [Holdemanella biformis]
MKRLGKRLISTFLAFVLLISNATIIHAEENQYTHSDEASSGGVTLKVEWNDPVLGQETTFHVSATGGSGNYKFRMEAPSYTDPDVLSYESVADPSRGEWLNYTEECSSHDYTFTMMASGTYNFRFYVMDKAANMNYLRTNTFIQVSSPNYPSVNSIVQSAVAQCNAETDGSDYAKALWLHDWLLNKLDYDKSLKWSSAESALTRGLGTCQSYESAYSKLLTAAGIENAETRDTYDGHTWNAFKINGEWYQVDCTWDDSNDDWYNFDERRLYFGLTDELMSLAHPGHAKIYTAAGYATRSTSLANNYFVKSGEAAKWVASYKDRIQENLNAGKTQFSITADNAAYPPSIYGIQNGIIAYVMNTTDWYVNGKKVDLVAKTNGAQFDFTGPCTEHKWDEGKVTTEPTCEKEGIKTYTCKNCQTTKTEVIKALGHNYSKGWTIDQEATCQQEGNKSHHCTRCDSKKDVTIIPKTSHTYSNDWTIDKAATCIDEGSKSHHCTRCDSKTDVTVIPKTGHNWDSGVVTTMATCTKDGVKTYTCRDCKTTKTEVIKALGHNYSNDWTIDKAATCQQEGSKSHHCTRCDSKTDVTVIPKTSHNWNAGVVTANATCTKDGVKTYTCRDCKTTKTEVIKALGHDYSSSWTIDKAATCTNEGSKSYHCTRCDSKKDVTVIPKISHSWDKGTILKNPTYSETGVKRYTCTKCGTTKDESIAKLVDDRASILYKTHVQDIGWQDFVQDGKMSGTSGRSKRLEGIQIKLSSKLKGNVEYQTHVQDIGWQGWKSNGTMSGTSGQSKRLEAIRIKLSGEIANKYDVYYRVHCQDFGWLGWAKNGEASGSEGFSKRLEGIEIRLVKKGDKAPGTTNNAFIRKSISYRTHVQDYGWQGYVYDGQQSGTSGQSKRLEGINIKLSPSLDGNIVYRTHVQDYGWQDWKSNDAMSGTSGQSKRLEAIQIKLTGQVSNEYDVYYRVHCQNFGWLGWAKDGESSGSEGYSRRLEAIQICLVPKGQKAPGDTNNRFYRR